MWKFRLCCNHRAYSDKILALMPVCWENVDKHKSIYGKSNVNKMENNDTKNFTWKPF